MTSTVVDEWIKTTDGNDIFTKTWKTSSAPVATLVMIHGFGEHIARYDRMFSVFVSQGIECYGYDQRGWGETGKKSNQFGNNQGYDTALKDIDNAVLKTKRENIPLFLMGHSMGGGLILNYLARGDKLEGVKLVTGAISSAPLVTLSMAIPAPKYYGLRFVSNFLPSFTIQTGVDAAGISHDQEEVKKYLEDPLVHDFATLATLGGFLDAGKDIIKSKAKLINTPVLYSHGDIDPINDYKGTLQAYGLTPSTDKEMKTWPGLFHELHNETMPQRQEVSDYYVNWIKNRLPAVKN
ncbi:Alpha/Beta hydrolase protein [Helicostylum pulchrum]|uniref:Serine aminopeptidase S33 domain-containing protein n=1 Tax=Helicostylum pulchrum TaxID=562976 RepID=A0ABP9Y9H7_9FUNG|nr:Alpha/Beta hydrolase protein [Helicostylum pulchrum]